MSEERFNILFAIKGMDVPGGGAERVLAEVAGELAARGHRISLLSWDRAGGESYYKLHPAIKRVVMGLGSTSKPATPLITLRRICAMRARVRSLSPDIVIGFSHSMYIPMGLALLFTGIPQIASEHTVYTHYQDKTVQRLLLHLAPYFVKKITCVSRQALESFPTALRRKMVVSNNPVTLTPSRMADAAGKSNDPKVLLSVGGLTRYKDHATLIESFALLSDNVSDWHLRIVGTGELYDRLNYQVESLGLSNRIHLVGAVKNISEEYANAQLFVIPSRYESFSLVTIEAMVHGLPIVGFADCQGVNHFITDGYNGVLVSPNPDRVKALAMELEKLMLDPQARERLIPTTQKTPAQYRLENVVDRWELMIAETLKG